MDLPFLRRENILQVLEGFNPWWTKDRPFHVPPFKRSAYAAALTLSGHERLRRATLLAGPRRTGKSTILYQVAAHHLAQGRHAREVLYVSMDHPLLKLAGLDEVLRTYHAEVLAPDRPVLLLLDEIQYADDWASRLKLLVDLNPHYRIVATGSAALGMAAKGIESGAGRFVTVPVPPLSFFEFRHINDGTAEKAPALRPSDLFGMAPADLRALAGTYAALQPLFLRYLLIGGFPETARMGEDELPLAQRLLREDVVERVLRRDMPALYGIRKVTDLERLFIYLCLHSGGIMAHKTVADALEIGTATLANHLLALEQAHLVYRLPPIATGGKEVLKARNKYYLADAALRNAVVMRGREVLNQPAELGLLVETTVLRHLWAFHYREQPGIGYWRDSKAKREVEVDVVVRSTAYHMAIECKYRNEAELEEKGGLVTYCRREAVDKAFLVTRRSDDLRIHHLHGTPTPFLRVPAHLFCYLMGAAEQQHWTS